MSDLVERLRDCADDDNDCLPKTTVRAVAMREAADRIEALEAEAAALRKDAERYRWLRGGEIVLPCGDVLDAILDSAIQQHAADSR